MHKNIKSSKSHHNNQATKASSEADGPLHNVQLPCYVIKIIIARLYH